MNVPNCPVCGMKPEIYLYAETLIDFYHIKIQCKNVACNIRPGLHYGGPGGWPDDLSVVFNDWEYRTRKHAEKEGLEI